MRIVYSTAPPRVLHLSRFRLLAIVAAVLAVFALAVYGGAKSLAGYWIETRAPVAQQLAAEYASKARQKARQKQVAAVAVWQNEMAFLRVRAAHLTNTGDLLAARLRLPPVDNAPDDNALACYDSAQLGDYFDTLDRRYALLRVQSAAEIVAAQTVPMALPVVGARVWQSSGFGVRKDPFTGRRAFHAGYDYAAAVGSTVVAAASGIVTHSGRLGLYGNVVRIDHGRGVSTLYGHMHTIYARERQYVNKGDAIGEVGNTGRSSGPHLHYEVRINGKPRPVRSQINKLNKQRQINS
ncbi:MAG: M23 family metallopeptidase [Gammaproteobacteria bacterium]